MRLRENQLKLIRHLARFNLLDYAGCLHMLDTAGTEDQVALSPEPVFIPSACWRNIAPGILSTTRFTGMLLAGKEKLAVYDIGDGSMEWQVRAEGSLFYTKYGSYETKATGMILICENDKSNKATRNIIRQTMWNWRQTVRQPKNWRYRGVSSSYFRQSGL